MKKYLVGYCWAHKDKSGFGNGYVRLHHENLPTAKDITEFQDFIKEQNEVTSVVIIAMTEVSERE